MRLIVIVKPGSRSDSIGLNEAEQLSVRLQAIPKKGNANDYLIKYLAQFFDCSQSKITIISGHTSRKKTLEINLPEAQIVAHFVDLR